MARCRIVKPEFWDDEKLSKISFQARLTYIGIWNFCDDYGVTKANSLWLKSRIFPYDDKLSQKEFDRWITELVDLKRVFKFSSGGDFFFYLPNFPKHQIINRPSKARYPAPPDELESAINERSMSNQGALMDEIEVEVEIEREIENNDARARAGEGSVSDFSRFWDSYPKKVGKIATEKSWNKANGKRPPLESILAKLDQLKKSPQWKKDGGQFIPNPATWINQGRWDDEAPSVQADECPGFDWSKP